MKSLGLNRHSEMFLPLLLLAVVFFYLIPASPAYSQLGGVGVSPTRVVFEGRIRNAEVLLINSSEKEIVYRIIFENKRMKDNGQYEIITEPKPGELFANKMIVYSPRQVTVPPKSTQTVRLLLRKPRNLPVGEYRSHLLLQSLPPAEDSGTDLESALKEREISIKFVPILGISIPVIIRHGNLQATAKVSEVSFKPAETPEDTAHCLFRLHRKGTKSLYGKVTVTHISKAGQETQLGLINGVSLFTPNTTRMVDVQLEIPESLKLENGHLRMTFQDWDGEKDGAILATADFKLR